MPRSEDAETAAFVITWQGAADRRALLRGHHAHDAARELVDGQERDGDADGHPDQAGRLHAGSAGADSRVADAGRSARRRSGSRTSCTCRAGCASTRRGSRLRSERHRIPITSTSTPGRVDSFKYAATRPQQWPPNTVGRYRNTDPVLTNYLIRLARGEARRGLPLVPAARAVRQDRHPHDGAWRPIRTGTS